MKHSSTLIKSLKAKYMLGFEHQNICWCFKNQPWSIQSLHEKRATSSSVQNHSKQKATVLKIMTNAQNSLQGQILSKYILCYADLFKIGLSFTKDRIASHTSNQTCFRGTRQGRWEKDLPAFFSWTKGEVCKHLKLYIKDQNCGRVLWDIPERHLEIFQ